MDSELASNRAVSMKYVDGDCNEGYIFIFEVVSSVGIDMRAY